MSVPEIKKKAIDVVLGAIREGRLRDLTPRIVRQEVETLLHLDVGTLDTSEYKAVVKGAIAEAMEKDTETDNATREQRVAVEALKQHPREKQQKLSKKSKVQDTPPATSETETKPKAKPISNRPTKKGKSKAKESTEFKSAATIETSDEDEVKPKKAPASTSKVKEQQVAEPPKKRRKAVISDSDEDDSRPTKRKSNKTLRSRSSATPPSEGNETKPEVKADPHPASDSEFSVVDEPPKRRKAQMKATDKDKKNAKEKRPKKKAAELSKDEETIKRLKSLVFACGTRKVWSKELKGLDKPSEQIRRLKQILSDLGMTGRLSLEQAKSIRAKKELAQELEDVRQFEQTVTAQSSRNRKEVSPRGSDEEESGNEVPKKRKVNARRSIMEFLGDQSDDD